MRAISIARVGAALAAVAFTLPAFADNCPKLAGKTMCITGTHSWGTSIWTKEAVFGEYYPGTQDGSVTIAGNPGMYQCGGNNFANIVTFDTTGDTHVWVARVGAKGKSADGTGSIQPTTGYFRYKAIEGACPTTR